MSRRGKRQKATKPPIAPVVATPASKVRRCDDELTKLAEAMRPAHRRFAEGILGGKLGARAAIDAGFSATSARGIAYRLLKREDVRRYIRLAQREQAVDARVTLAAIVDRLWATVTDEITTAKAKAAAMRLLVRLTVARLRGAEDQDSDPGAAPTPSLVAAADDGLGLTDEKAILIEARILGVRR
jgi:hypothetical protein